MVPWANGWSTATAVDKGLHRVLRKTVVSGLHAKALRQFEGAIHRNLNLYLMLLTEGKKDRAGWSAVRDMRLWSK